ncbi:Hypothetical predicted protein [Pelobates cultripes]|uniref:Uncharacterized protein n=1 Tax=Pelobates cultripes TaxID=61616 RepID=A0AAD1RNK9_PELCU|nr:Hypothetical predicted protein [Pelobates cultripes]
MRKDVQELGHRTTHVESKMDEFASAHNDLADHLESLADKLALIEQKLADLKDRAWQNNLRLRGVPVSIVSADLPAYVWGLLHAYAPEVPADMLLVHLFADLSAATLRRRRDFAPITEALRAN